MRDLYISTYNVKVPELDIPIEKTILFQPKFNIDPTFVSHIMNAISSSRIKTINSSSLKAVCIKHCW